MLLDDRALAGPLLERVVALDRVGPPPLSSDEQAMRRAWARKMLARIGCGDVESNYRRHWLLTALLEDHFALRGQWYRGPKEALAQLRLHAPATCEAFERALAPGAPFDALEALVEHVVG